MRKLHSIVYPAALVVLIWAMFGVTHTAPKSGSSAFTTAAAAAK